MPVWSFTKQWLIMKRQHQCIFMDIYLQNLKETVKRVSNLKTWLWIKTGRSRRQAESKSTERNSSHTKPYSIMHASIKCRLVFSFPQWTKASMYNSHSTKTFQKYFIMIFSLQHARLYHAAPYWLTGSAWSVHSKLSLLKQVNKDDFQPYSSWGV